MVRRQLLQSLQPSLENENVFYLQSIILLPIHHLQKKRGDDIEPLTVAHPLVPARVSQQHPLQDGAILIVLLTTEAATARSV